MTGAKRQERWRARQLEKDMVEIRPMEPLSNAERQRRWRRREQPSSWVRTDVVLRPRTRYVSRNLRCMGNMIREPPAAPLSPGFA